MSAAKHTPGPWWVETYSDGTLQIHGNQRPSDDFDVDLYTTVVESIGGCIAGEENARLIAAAPELLEALRIAMLQIEYLHDKYQHTGTGNAALAIGNAAIAKATGEAQ